MERLLLKADEVAQVLGVGRSKAYQLIADGELPAVRLGGCVRVPREALSQWVAQLAASATEAVSQS